MPIATPNNRLKKKKQSTTKRLKKSQSRRLKKSRSMRLKKSKVNKKSPHVKRKRSRRSELSGGDHNDPGSHVKYSDPNVERMMKEHEKVQKEMNREARRFGNEHEHMNAGY